MDKITPHSITQPFTPPITTRPPKPGPEPDPGACVAPSMPISYTTHLGCVSIAKCNVGAVLLLPIPKTPWSTGHGPFRAVAPRSRAPLLRRASLPMPLGLYCFRVYERILCTHTHTHIRYSIPGPGCCLAIIVMIVVVMATSTHTSRAGISARTTCSWFLILICTIHFVCCCGICGTGFNQLRTRHTGPPSSVGLSHFSADSAAQYRSVPEVNSALAAASHRTMGAQPPCVLRFRA